jgi:hypothetical protein
MICRYPDAVAPFISNVDYLSSMWFHVSTCDRTQLTISSALPNEILFELLSNSCARDGFALARTNSDLFRRLIPEIYKSHVRISKYSEDKVPFSMMWAAWKGNRFAFDASVAALKAIGVEPQTVIERHLDGNNELEVYLRLHKRSWLSHYGITHGCPRLLELCCLRGHFRLASDLITMAGGITPCDENLHPLAFATTVEVVSTIVLMCGSDLLFRPALPLPSFFPIGS